MVVKAIPGFTQADLACYLLDHLQVNPFFKLPGRYFAKNIKLAVCK